MEKLITRKRPPQLIFTAADHRHIPGALIALYSAAQQHDSVKDYVLVTSHPHSHYLSRLTHQLFRSEGASLTIIPITELPVSRWPVSRWPESRWNGATSRFPAEAFARYFPDQLGSDAETVLYVDGDVLIMPAINEIALDYDADKCIYAFPEYHDLIKNRPFKNHDRLNLVRDEVYYQSGALLFDVPRYVESGVRNELEYILHQYGDTFDDPDQDAFNLAGRQHIGSLPAHLNSSPFFWRILPFKHDKLATIRFLGNLKPWDRRAYKIPHDLLDMYDSYAFNLNLTNPIMGPRNQYHRYQQPLFNIKFWCENWLRFMRARSRLMPLMGEFKHSSVVQKPSISSPSSPYTDRYMAHLWAGGR